MTHEVVAAVAAALAIVIGAAIAVLVCRRNEGALKVATVPCIALYALTLGVGAYAGSRSVDSPLSVIAVSLVLAVVTIAAVTDVQTGLIFDAITLPACATIVLLGICAHQTAATLVGAAAGAGLPAVLYAITAGRGIGFGDVKLGACIGAGLGAFSAMYVFGLAFIAGAALGVALLVAKRATRKTEIRFAPYLAFATACIVVCR